MFTNLINPLLSFLNLTWFNTLVTIISIIIALISFTDTIVKISAIVILLLILILFKKFKKKNPSAAVINQTKTQPFTSSQVVTPPQFIGREPELNFLRQSLQKGNSISLLGKYRMGKSSLLATWSQSLLKEGYQVLLLDGKKLEGHSLQAFIQVIIQKSLAEDISADHAADVLVKWAKQQYEENQTKPLILVDECQIILQKCPHRFWERLRGGGIGENYLGFFIQTAVRYFI